jgi:hypothetical protein
MAGHASRDAASGVAGFVEGAALGRIGLCCDVVRFGGRRHASQRRRYNQQGIQQRFGHTIHSNTLVEVKKFF